MRQALQLAVAGVAVLALIGAFEVTGTDGARRGVRGAPASASASPCSGLFIEEGGSCVPLPARGGALGDTARAENAEPEIPRFSERPADVSRYRWPCEPSSVAFATRPGAHGEEAGGAAELRCVNEAPIRPVPLAEQEDDTEVVFAGELVGLTVVTLHRVRDGVHSREYVVLYERLGRIADGIAPKTRLRPNQSIGSAGEVSLRMETRRLRAGTERGSLSTENLTSAAWTLATDPRNVLPLIHP